MYFFRGYAIHGAYWHNNFGTPVSHGCVNMRVEEAKALYEWASVGMEVVVHE
jgi:lipoprotein-anchoring transpeptidase ErfK/SrfK